MEFPKRASLHLTASFEPSNMETVYSSGLRVSKRILHVCVELSPAGIRMELGMFEDFGNIINLAKFCLDQLRVYTLRCRKSKLL
jgi:hypothetical protein